MTQASPHNLASLLAQSARRWPRLPAVALGAKAMHDYAALAHRAARLAYGLKLAGLVAGDRVLLVSRNTPQYVEALFGCWWAGFVAVPSNAKLHERELAHVLDNSDARFVLHDRSAEATVATLVRARGQAIGAACFGDAAYDALLAHDEAPSIAPVSPDAPAWLFYTSGTTGRAKGVIISHANLRAMTACFLQDVETIAPGDAIIHAAPLSHGSGLYVLPHIARGAVNVVPQSGGFEPDEIFALLGTWNRSLLFAAPTMVRRIVAAPSLAGAPLDRLKCIVYGGGPMYVEDCKRAYAALGPRLAQIYGQGESPMTITAMDRATLADSIESGDDARIASVGSAQSGLEVRIAGADDATLPAGAVGEVLVRGPTVMQGYWRNEDASARALAGGWLHTGDLGVVDADGFLTLKDRLKDLIISGGSNIYPREVEEVLLAHPAVAEVAVIGRRHEEWGEEVVAVVVPRQPLADGAERASFERALDRHCLDAIARFKRPRAYFIVAELPKNETGKVLKRALRERIASS